MSSEPSPSVLVVRGCDVLRVPETGECWVVTNQDIVVVGNVIESISPTGGSVDPAAQIIDGRGLLATPGLVNTHTHSPMVLFRGAAEDVPVAAWFNERVWPMESNLTEDDVAAGAMLACAEMIQGGTTAFADHYFFEEAIARSVASAGLRANIAPTYFSSRGREALDATVEFAGRWNGAAGGRISTSMGPHAPYTVDDDDLAEVAAHARRLGIRVHIHASENIDQTRSSLQRRGITPIEVLSRTGVLDAGVLIAHGCGIVPSDYELLGTHSATTSVVSCPKVYLKHALAPLTPVGDLQQLGVGVAAGTDGAAGHNTLDMWESMRLLAMTQKYQTTDAMVMTTSDTVRLAMRGGAAALGLGDPDLRPGGPADIVLVDLGGSHHQPVHDARAALVYGMQTSDVRTVIVDGQVLMRDRQLLTIDLPEVIADVVDRVKRLTTIREGRSVQCYNP